MFFFMQGFGGVSGFRNYIFSNEEENDALGMIN